MHLCKHGELIIQFWKGTGNDSFTSLPTNVNQILETEKGARMKTYTVEDIREAVDIVIGDDGGRAEEVIEVLAYRERRDKND